MKNHGRSKWTALTRQGLAFVLVAVMLLGYFLPGGVQATEDPTDPTAETTVPAAEETTATEPEGTTVPTEVKATETADKDETEVLESTTFTRQVPVLMSAARSTVESGLIFNKSAMAREDGTYNLELTLQGTVGTEENKTPMDLIIIVDRSASMIKDTNGNPRDRLVKAKAAAQTLITTVAENDAVDVRYTIVDFAGSGHSPTIDDAVAGNKVDGQVDVVKISNWYTKTDVDTAKNHINQIEVRESLYSNAQFTYIDSNNQSVTKTGFYYSQAATNYEAVFRQVNTIKTRPNAMKVVVFLTDGDPTCAWTAIESDTNPYPDTRPQGYIDNQWNSEGYGTTFDGQNNVTKCLTAAEDEINALTADRFYMVGIGEAKRLETVNTYASKVPYKQVINTDSSNLENEFKKIGTTLNELFYTDVTITDTLSHEDNQLMVKITDESTIGITVKNGDVVVAQSAAGEKIVTVPATSRNSEAELRASYDASTDQLKLEFPDNYKLEPNYTYILSAVIEPTEKAYRKYRDVSEAYTDTADAGTGTHAGLEKGGFYSNDQAVVNYAYGDQAGLIANYKMPVVRLTPGKLVVTKEIVGLTDEEIEELDDLKFDITITYPDDGNGVADETVAKTVELSQMTKNGDGTYSYEITGLSPNTAYTVTESGGAVDGYDMTTKVNGEAANETKAASGTVGKGATVTVAYENNYAVSITNVKVEKQVTGNMGDWNKPFTFTASLSVRTDSMAGVEYVKYAKDVDGTPVAGATTAIATQTFEFTLKDNEYIIFYRVPLGAELTVAETPDDYVLKNVEATKIPEGQQLKRVDNSVVLNVIALPSGDDNVGHEITFTNDKEVTIDTGVVLDSLPYILILVGVVAVGVILFVRKRRIED